MKSVALLACLVLALVVSAAAIRLEKPGGDAAFKKAAAEEKAFEKKECLFQTAMHKMQYKLFGNAEIERLNNTIPIYKKAMRKLEKIVQQHKSFITTSRNVTSVDTARRSSDLFKLDWAEYNRKITYATKKIDMITVQMAREKTITADEYCEVPLFVRNKVAIRRAQIDEVRKKIAKKATKAKKAVGVMKTLEKKLEENLQLLDRSKDLRKLAKSPKAIAKADAKIADFQTSVRNLRNIIAVKKKNLAVVKKKKHALKFLKDGLACALREAQTKKYSREVEDMISDFVKSVHALSDEYIAVIEKWGDSVDHLNYMDLAVLELTAKLETLQKQQDGEEKVKKDAQREIKDAKNAGEAFLAQKKFNEAEAESQAIHSRMEITRDSLEEYKVQIQAARAHYVAAVEAENKVNLRVRGFKDMVVALQAKINRALSAPPMKSPNTSAAVPRFSNLDFDNAERISDGAALIEGASEEESAEAKAYGKAYNNEKVGQAVAEMLETEGTETAAALKKKAVAAKKVVLGKRQVLMERSTDGVPLEKAKVEDLSTNRYNIPMWAVSHDTFTPAWYKDQRTIIPI